MAESSLLCCQRPISGHSSSVRGGAHLWAFATLTIGGFKQLIVHNEEERQWNRLTTQSMTTMFIEIQTNPNDRPRLGTLFWSQNR